jgi:hypothetical protein
MALVAGEPFLGTEIGAARLLKRITADRRKVSKLRRSSFENGLAQNRVIAHDALMLGGVIEPDQSTDP